MHKLRTREQHRAELRLRMTMQDTLDGIQELALMCSYDFPSDCMQILSIEPADPAPPPAHAGEPAEVIAFPVLAQSA